MATCFPPRRYSRFLCGAGAVLGLTLAATGALNPTDTSLPRGVVARVNGKVITEHDLAVALERTGGEGATPTANERKAALGFLIDQELLVQRGVTIGLLDSDQTVRKALSMAVIDAVVADVLTVEPTDEDLHAFHASHQAVFTTPARAHVQHIAFHDSGDLATARSRAEQALTAIANGMTFIDAKARYGDPDEVPLPDALMSVHLLPRYLGPTLAEIALSLQPGAISQLVSLPPSYHLLRLAEFQSERVQPYEEVKLEVRNEYLHRKRDDALQQRLDHLRARAAIVLPPTALVGKPAGGGNDEQTERLGDDRGALP